MNKPRALDDSLPDKRDITRFWTALIKPFTTTAERFHFMGKAVRSRFTLLLGDALGLERGAAARVGAAAELIHTASLLRDDCIDRAALRRRPPHLNESQGINTAILVGTWWSPAL